MLNQDSRLIAKIDDDSAICPNPQNLTSEILQKHKLITSFANAALPDYPIIEKRDVSLFRNGNQQK